MKAAFFIIFALDIEVSNKTNYNKMKKLNELITLAQSRDKKRLAVAYAIDHHTLEAVSAAVELGFVDAILVGDRHEITRVAEEHNIDLSKFIIQEEQTDVKCVERAVELVKTGQADILMKGMVSSDKYMRGILHKEKGLVPQGATLSHITLLEVATYHKLLILSDVAVIPYPDLKQKLKIVEYLTATAHNIGIENPKIALVGPSEQVLAGLPSSFDAAIIAKMWDRGQIAGAIVDGPLSLDTAIDMESVEIKKLVSPVAGDADCILFPNLDCANVFFKTATKLAGASMAAVVVGAVAPCVLTSRGDNIESKLLSIALAAVSVK